MPRRSTALTVPFEDPGVFDIGDVTEAVGDHEENEISDMGEVFACCPIADNGHLFLTQCGVTRCVHCKTVVAV